MTIKSTSILLVGSLAAAVVHAETPVFEPISAKTGHFVEQFTDDWEERWSPSAATKVDRNQEVFSYVGKWAVEEPSVFPGIKGDKGLVAKSKAAHHAISSLFETPYDAEKEGGLVLQYEVKLQNGLECGGAYTKLLLDSAQGIQAQELSDKTPYTIMFGPDRCGSTNKVHFIFRHKNPLTGEYEEKHLKSPPTPKHDKVSTLYTLIVRKDNTYEIKIDGQSKKSGSLLTDFDPPVNPEKQIDDPNDTKPADWVDEAKITDPDATKPDDWDEDAPFEIEDLDAVKPAGWLDDEPALIPDPDAEKPEEWSDEDDGDWIPPSVPNPKVADAPGSGPWIRPKKPNPDYKGKWFAPKIDNPAYKGVWAPRKIENPDFFEDDVPYAFSPIAGVAFEWWTMQENIMVDNIYLGNSEKAAADFAAATFDVKKPIEEAAEKASKPVTSDDDDSAIASLRDFSIPSFLADPVNYARSQVTGFVQSAVKDPKGTVQRMPQTAAIVGGLAATLLGMIGLLLGLLAPKPATVKAKSKKVVDKTTVKIQEVKSEAEATASNVGAKKVDNTNNPEMFVKQRTTRSTTAAAAADAN